MGTVLSVLSQLATTATEGLSGLYQPAADLEEQVASTSARIGIGASIGLIVLVIITALIKDRIPKLKLPLFISILLITVFSTAYMAGSTIYVNVNSDSGGPVHWHADMEIWACGNELELRDPYEFLSNKIGTSTLHEHNDRRIHLEGVVVDDSRDASLGKFFHVIDGALSADALVVPLNKDGGPLFENDIDGDGPTDSAASLIDPYVQPGSDGFRYGKFVSGQTCGDQTAYVQTFVFQYNEDADTFTQQKLADPVTYSIAPHSTVPAGDCVVIEFDVLKDQTNKLCEQYGIRDVTRCEQFGVGADEKNICNSSQTNYPAVDPNQEQLEPEPEPV